MFRFVRTLFGTKTMGEQEYESQKSRILSLTPVPVVWLFGKTGSGKTSIVKYLTGAEEAEIGSGFMPQTRQSRQFNFPSSDQPLIRFIDTRGLVDSQYDPTEDIRVFDTAAHVMLVTVRTMDHALAGVINPLRRIRQSNPRRPVILVLTCLHEAYPGDDHPSVDPLDDELLSKCASAELAQSISLQKHRFATLVDHIVAIDFTRPDAGFAEPHLGGERLKAAMLQTLPSAYRQTFLNASDTIRPLKNLNEQRAMPYVVSYSTMAATAAAVPTPWVDIPLVLAIQSHLVDRLRKLYGQKLDPIVLRDLAAATGGRLAMRLAFREALKFVPIAGSLINVALAYAYTYGLGSTCCWYFGEIQAGNAPTIEEVQRVWEDEFVRVRELWKERERYGRLESHNQGS
jgi:uncharacterized protein (DUF697 family)/predicted GTPase